MYRHFK